MVIGGLDMREWTINAAPCRKGNDRAPSRPMALNSYSDLAGPWTWRTPGALTCNYSSVEIVPVECSRRVWRLEPRLKAGRGGLVRLPHIPLFVHASGAVTGNAGRTYREYKVRFLS